MKAELLLSRFEALFTTPDAIEQLRQLLFERALCPLLEEGDASSWTTLNLDRCATIFTGTSISAADKVGKFSSLSGAVPFIATKDVLGRDGSINYDTDVAIPENEAGFRIAEPGTILICAEGGSAGRKIGLVERRVCFGNKLFAVYPDPALVSPAYLFRIFQSSSFFKQFKSKMTGIIGGISLSNFKNLSVRLPPIEKQVLVEQKLSTVGADCAALTLALTNHIAARRAATSAQLEIVSGSRDSAARTSAIDAVLNSSLVALDDGVSLDAVRDAIIDASVRGLILPGSGARSDQRQVPSDLRTGNELPTPTELEGPFSLPQGWRWVSLAALVNPSRFISYGVIKLGEDDPSGTPVLRCSDVRYRRIELGSVKKVSPIIEAPYQRTRLKGGEVLVNIRGTLGGCAVVPPELAGYNIAREVAMIDPNSLVLPEYLLNVISSPYFRAAIETDLRGIAYKGINLRSLSKIPVPLPSTSIQSEIVERVDRIVAAVEQVRSAARMQESCRAKLLEALIEQLSFGGSDGGGGKGDAFLPVHNEAHVPSVPSDSLHAGASVIEQPSSDLSPGDYPKSRLEEALLVGAIVDAFFDEVGEPVGNFRIQKAVYFSKRRLGETRLHDQFLRKAAGPYNPALRYEGGIAQAKSLQYIREAKGRFGFGYITGSAAQELRDQLSSYDQFREIAKWIVGRLRFVDNEEWELLATVDYATEALRTSKVSPSADEVLAYIARDDEWRAKIGRLSLTQPKVQRAMMFAQALLTAS